MGGSIQAEASHEIELERAISHSDEMDLQQDDDERLPALPGNKGLSNLANFSYEYESPVYSIGDLSDNVNLQLKDFKIVAMVGKGGFGKVYQVIRQSDERIFALKTMRKDMIIELRQVDNVNTEKNILKKCSESKFVVHLLSTFKDPVHLFMVQEFLPGGNLLGYIKDNGHLENEHASFYAGEIYLGLSYLHSNGIVYRDLKPDNILFDMNGHIRIADLGFAKVIGAGGITSTFCGTPSYLAPEVILKKPYGFEVDWWAFGIIIFQLLCGCSPFHEAKHISTFARILKCAIRWPPEPQRFFSNDAFDLISWLMEVDPANRPFREEISSHPWFGDMDFKALENREIPSPIPVQVLAQRQAILSDPYITDSVKRKLVTDSTYEAKKTETFLSEARHEYVEMDDLFKDF